MLPLFRRKKDWLKWTLLLVIFALGFTTVLLFVRTPSGIVGGLGTQEVALVAGEPISAAQFSRYYRQVLEFYRQLYNLDQTNPDMIKQLGVGQQALNQMINQYAAVHAAGELGLSVSPKEVIERISIMFQENGRFIGTQRYTELLRSQNISTKEFEDSVRRGLLNQKLRNILTDGVVATPDEVKNSFNETNEEVKLRYVLIDSAEVQKEVVTEEMLKEFFEENRESFRRDESRKVSYISVYVSPTEVEVADEAVEAEMTEMPVEEQVRARHILIKIEDDTEKAREKAEEILAEIRDGGNFANLARKHSEDPVSAEKGGDLGFFGRGQMVPEFENVAFDQEVNQISDLVESPFGFHIIQTLEKAGTDGPSMRAIAEFRARSNEAEKRTAEQANKIAKELEAGSMTLEEAAEEYSLELNESSHFTQTQPSPGLNYGLDFTDAVFSSEVGGVVGPFSSQGRFVLARLEEITPSSLPEYSAIPDEVRTRFEEERSDDLTRDAAFEFFNKVEAAESFAEAAKQNDLEIVETEFFKRNSMIDENLRYYPAIQEQAFALEVGKVSTPVYTGGDYVVFEVSEKSAFDEVQFENAKESLTDQLSQQKRDEFYSSFLQNAVGELRREGQIVINQELVQRITG